MKIEIDVDNIVKKMDINKLVEENIISNITNIIDFGNLADELLEDKEVKSIIDKKIFSIIIEYISSEEGKQLIIDTFKDKISDSDIITDDIVVETVSQFLKKALSERL